MDVTAVGYCNSGDWNIDTPQTIRVFGKDISIKLWDNAYKPAFLFFMTTEWVSSDAMTKQEKTENPFHAVTGGIVRTYSYKEAFQRSWENADPEDRIKVKDLPNFDAEIFYQISGIDLREEKVRME